MEGVLALARGVLLSKSLALPAVSKETAEYLCVIIVQVSQPAVVVSFSSTQHSSLTTLCRIESQAVLQSITPMQTGSPPMSPRVRFVAVLGPETMASCSIDGVLLDILLPSDLNGPLSNISQMEDFKVLLFSEALEPREPGLAGVHCHTATTESFPTTAEGGDSGDGGDATTAYEIAEAHASRFESMGIRLVACRELDGYLVWLRCCNQAAAQQLPALHVCSVYI
eukprot:COSAG02_NODE_3280_length_7026_cov_3.334200_2_plen_225_part_00